VGIRRRTRTIAFALAALSALAACEPVGQAGIGPDVRRELDQGREAAATWIARGRSATALDAPTVISLGYVERLRLGLGSPFRLIDYALADPRLDLGTRRTLGWALLARTLDRAAYQIDETALDRAGLGDVETMPSVGHHHLELIENAVRESSDPRSGELAVRLAYALAAAEGTLPARAPELATRAAALLRDRELARADVLRLLRAADASGQDPLAMVPAWRSQRLFHVEQPAMTVLAQQSELSAMDLAPRLARALRDLLLRADEIQATRQHPAAGSAGVLSHAAARQLGAIADTFNAPPQAPITIAARLYRREMIEHTRLSDAQREQRTRFVEQATSEERFVAEYALLGRRATYDVAPALAALAAATSMRAYAQEPVWFPGFGGPSARELEERFGITMRFGEEVPADWRPYYRRMLDLAFTDLHRVLPALDLRGLTVVVSEEAERQAATLAMHDPRKRRLLLPPTTTAGTIAHEVAHDLDWQVALRRYHVRGDYATDRATRTRSDRLAMRVHDLANGSLEPAQPGARLAAHARRPAEVFARNIDWFVAVTLAAEGRVNGYLSSVQDDILTGYGTVRPPDVTGAAGQALVKILDEVAPIYPATREWFLKSYGLDRSLTPYDLIRRVLDVSAGEDAAAMQPLQFASSTTTAIRFAGVDKAREVGLEAIDSWICRAPAAAYNRELERSRRMLVAEAAAARARGLALAQAKRVAGPEGARWVARDLYGAPWPVAAVDSTMAELLAPLTERVRTVAQVEIVQPERFDLTGRPERCALAPLHLN
jgi:hypothetical protein